MGASLIFYSKFALIFIYQQFCIHCHLILTEFVMKSGERGGIRYRLNCSITQNHLENVVLWLLGTFICLRIHHSVSPCLLCLTSFHQFSVQASVMLLAPVSSGVQLPQQSKTTQYAGRLIQLP